MSHALAVAARSIKTAMEKTSKQIALNSYIEHTLLKAEATMAEVEQLCREAEENGFYGVCIAPYYVGPATKLIGSGKTKIITVIGFPFGYSPVSAKVEETKRAFERGAHEVDMVMNLSAFRNEDYNLVKDDIDSVSTIAHMHDKVVKVIIESGILTDAEIAKACELCVETGVDFVKTSTGYAKAGASVEHVKLMRMLLPAKVKIKASGGIRDKAFAQALVEAGAVRLGSSSGVTLVS
jgi:deoxyribose-phosphate aldolase